MLELNRSLLSVCSHSKNNPQPNSPRGTLVGSCTPRGPSNGSPRATESTISGALVFRDRGDSACGLRPEQRGSDGMSKAGPEPQRCLRARFAGSSYPCHTAEAAVQTTHGTPSVADYDADAQLFELRRVAHRAEAECGEARTAQKKAQQVARVAEDQCKDTRRQMHDLQAKVSHQISPQCLLSNGDQRSPVNSLSDG